MKILSYPTLQPIMKWLKQEALKKEGATGIELSDINLYRNDTTWNVSRNIWKTLLVLRWQYFTWHSHNFYSPKTSLPDHYNCYQYVDLQTSVNFEPLTVWEFRLLHILKELIFYINFRPGFCTLVMMNQKGSLRNHLQLFWRLTLPRWVTFFAKQIS